MQALENTIRRVSILLGCLVLLLMMFQIVVDVFMREFLGAGFPATPDIVARYYMVAASFLPLALTEIKRRHIEATIFTSSFKGLTQALLFVAGFVLSIAIYGVILYTTTSDALRQTARGSYLQVGTIIFPTWPSYWILPFAISLMLVVLFIRIIQVLTGRFSDSEHDPLEELESLEGDA
jgi:TRAP-type C4-dicarboxylate transport system permease small subunit